MNFRVADLDHFTLTKLSTLPLSVTPIEPDSKTFPHDLHPIEPWCKDFPTRPSQ